MPSNKIRDFLMKLTREETKEALKEVLANLPQEDALEVIREWVKEEGLEGEID